MYGPFCIIHPILKRPHIPQRVQLSQKKEERNGTADGYLEGTTEPNLINFLFCFVWKLLDANNMYRLHPLNFTKLTLHLKSFSAYTYSTSETASCRCVHWKQRNMKSFIQG